MDKWHSCARLREVAFKSLEATARVLDKGLLFCSSERRCEGKRPGRKRSFSNQIRLASLMNESLRIFAD
jgi:hypothetical protein